MQTELNSLALFISSHPVVRLAYQKASIHPPLILHLSFTSSLSPSQIKERLREGDFWQRCCRVLTPRLERKKRGAVGWWEVSNQSEV